MPHELRALIAPPCIRDAAGDACGTHTAPAWCWGRSHTGPESVDALTKGELRKLNALKKSVGDEIGEQAFLKRLKIKPKAGAVAPRDRNVALITETLGKLVQSGGLRIPRGGYVVTCGRGRVGGGLTASLRRLTAGASEGCAADAGSPRVGARWRLAPGRRPRIPAQAAELPARQARAQSVGKGPSKGCDGTSGLESSLTRSL